MRRCFHSGAPMRMLSSSGESGGDAALGLFTADIDLDQHGEGLAELFGGGVQSFGQFCRVERIDGVKESPPPSPPCWIAGGQSCGTRRRADSASAPALSANSCTRFSPNKRWPASYASRMRAAGKVLVTAISADVAGFSSGAPRPRERCGRGWRRDWRRWSLLQELPSCSSR